MQQCGMLVTAYTLRHLINCNLSVYTEIHPLYQEHIQWPAINLWPHLVFHTHTFSVPGGESSLAIQTVRVCVSWLQGHLRQTHICRQLIQTRKALPMNTNTFEKYSFQILDYSTRFYSSMFFKEFLLHPLSKKLTQSPVQTTNYCQLPKIHSVKGTRRNSACLRAHVLLLPLLLLLSLLLLFLIFLFFNFCLSKRFS